MSTMRLFHADTDVPGQAVRLFVGLRNTIEETFLQAGNGLGRAVEDFNGLGAKFAALELAIGGESQAELARLTECVEGHMTTLEGDCDSFQAISDELRTAIRSIVSEVRELDQVVRTIANISINSRIQGNSLVPRRPQVSAFTERLSTMSEESVNILAEINDTMSTVSSDVATMAHEQQDMLRELRQRVIPAIAGFSALSERMRDSQVSLTTASKDLAAQSVAITKAVSQLIISLQNGDSTRQRLERVEETLEEAKPGRRGDAAGALIDLALGLSHGASSTATDQAETAIGSLNTILDSGQAAVRSARMSAFGQNMFLAEGRGTSERDSLRKGLETNLAQFAALKASAKAVHDRLDVIRTHEETLREIAHQIRLSGINAVIICAKLGSDGRALRELAHWLRDLTDESDTVVQRLQQTLANTRRTIQELTSVQTGGIESCLSQFRTDSEKMNDLLERTTAAVHSTNESFSRTAQALPANINEALQGMSQFVRSVEQCDTELEMLREFRRIFAPLDGVHIDDDTGAVLERLRARYTMESERQIHDGILAKASGAAVIAAPLSVAAPAAESAADAEADLDDILF